MKSPVRFLLLLGLLASAALAHGADTSLVLRTTVVPVGTLGTSLTFPMGWGRQVLNPQLGKDQFRKSGAEEYLIVVEIPGFLVHSDILTSSLDLRQGAIQSENPSSVASPLGPLRTAEGLMVRRRLDLKVGSLDLSYLVGTIGIRGARYFVIAWTLPRNFSSLVQDVDAIMGSLSGDPQTPEWTSRTKVGTVVASGAGGAVMLRYSEAVWSKRTPYAPNLVKLVTSEEDLEAFVRTGTMTGTPSDLAVGSGPSARTLGAVFTPADSKDGANRLTVRLTPGPGEGLELVVEGSLGRGALEAAAQDLLSELTVEAGDFQQALPPEAGASVSAHRGPVQELVQVSRREGLVPERIESLFTGLDGAPWLLTEKGAGTLVGGQWHPKAQAEGVSGPAAVGPATFFVAGDPVRASLGSGFHGQEWSAEVLVGGRGRDGVGLLRTAGDAQTLVPFGPGEGQSHTLFLRSAGGTETPVVTLPRVRLAAFDAAGDQVLAVSADSPSGGQTLLRVDVGGRKVHRGGTWSSVEEVSGMEGGWMVSGQPEDGGEGLWFLGTDGSVRHLSSGGSWSPLGILAGRLWYSLPAQWESPGASWRSRNVFSVDLDELARHPAPAGLSGGALNRAGRAAALAEGYPRLPTQAAAASLVDRVRREVEAAVGSPLPWVPRDLDAVLGSLRGDNLEPPGFRALTVLLLGAYLDSGAEWVASDRASEAFQPWADPTSIFSRSLFLPAIVYSLLYEEEGWYDPVASVLDSQEGRGLLVGLDPEALERRRKALDDPRFDALVTGSDKAPLAQWLQEPTRRSNSALVRAVVERLWRQGDVSGLKAVLEALGPHGGPVATLARHLVAWKDHGAVLATPGDFRAVFGTEPEAAIEGLKTLVSATEREPMALYFLAKAWELSSFPYARVNARQCYQAIENQYRASEGLKLLVRTELARLDDGS